MEGKLTGLGTATLPLLPGGARALFGRCPCVSPTSSSARQKTLTRLDFTRA
jgi:hypothetical protein